MERGARCHLRSHSGTGGRRTKRSNIGARRLPSYRLAWQECWLWHIAPLGTETVAYGEVHRVGAFALEQSGAKLQNTAA